jgi:hypothetical protein
MPVGFARSLFGSRGPTRTASTATLWSTSGTFSYDLVAGKFNNAYSWNTSSTHANGFYITTPQELGNSGFPGTVEFWIYFPSFITSQTYFAMDRNEVPTYVLNGTSNDLRHNSGYGSITFYNINVNTPSAANWHHMAFTNPGSGTWTWYLNGTSIGTAGLGGGFTQFAFGKGTTGGSSNGLRIDEIRISKIRRYTANFTPSSSAFSNDSDTLALFHCETDPAEDDIN